MSMLRAAALVTALALTAFVFVGATEGAGHAALAVVHLSAADLTWIDTGADVSPGLAYPVSAVGRAYTAPVSFSNPTPGQGREGESSPAGEIYTCYGSACPLN